MAGPIEIAWLGHSGSHTSQLMHSSVMTRDIALQTSIRFTRSCRRSSTKGDTNLETSPARVAISRTNVPETNWNWSLGVMNTVSTSGISWRFMPAIWNSYSKSLTARSPRTTTSVSYTHLRAHE